MPRLGILAGGGDLPRVLLQSCLDQSRDVFVVAFDGQADPDWVRELDVPHMTARLGAAGAVIRKLKEEGVRELVFAGSIRRPSLSELRPDWRAAKLFAKKSAQILGDDSLLKAVRDELEIEGFTLLGAHEVADDILAPEGVMGRFKPSKSHKNDFEHGIFVTQTLGRLDIGQAAVIQQGLVLGVEAIEGTDQLVKRCKDLTRKGEKGVLVKTCKPQQDRRLDMPTIGIKTIDNVADAGLAGVAVHAGQTIMLGRKKIIDRANERGIFLIGVHVPECVSS